MTTIELTDQQREALPAEQSLPIDVVDPATQRRYVLIAREQYERVRPILEGAAAPIVSQAREPAPGVPPPGGPMRQRIRDLPLPPEIAEEAKRWCQRLGLWGKRSRRETEEQMKLQHYYGGKWIAELLTEDGIVVVACAESLDDPSFDQQLAFLTESERKQRLIECPVKLFDDESQILDISTNES